MRASGAIDLNGDQLTLLVTAAQQDETPSPRQVTLNGPASLVLIFRSPGARRSRRRSRANRSHPDLQSIAGRIDPKRASGFIATIGQNLLPGTAFRRQARDARRVAPLYYARRARVRALPPTKK